MKKKLKVFINSILLVAIVICAFPASSLVLAAGQANIYTVDEGEEDNIVLGYYDISTGKETLYTEEQLEKEFSIDAKKLTGAVKTKARKATKAYKKTKLTKQQKKEIATAKEDASIGGETFGIQVSDGILGNNIKKIESAENFTASNMGDYSDRMLVSKNASYYNLVCKLTGEGDFYDTTNSKKFHGTSSGTGFAVGKKLCATARHCITDSYGNWLTNIKAYYGYDGDANEYTNLLTNVAGYVFFLHI